MLYKKKNINFVNLFLKQKGINIFMFKKIQAYIGFNFFKYERKYLNKRLFLFKKLLFLLKAFVNSKILILKEKLFLLFNLWKKINHYKGKRLIFFLPLNGQRTHTNAQTLKNLFFKNVKKKKI